MSVPALPGAPYSLYLVYVGTPLLMRVPPEKSLVDTAVLAARGIVLGLLVGAVGALVTPGSTSMGGGDVRISIPKGEVTINGAPVDGPARKLEETGRPIDRGGGR